MKRSLLILGLLVTVVSLPACSSTDRTTASTNDDQDDGGQVGMVKAPKPSHGDIVR